MNLFCWMKKKTGRPSQARPRQRVGLMLDVELHEVVMELARVHNLTFTDVVHVGLALGLPTAAANPDIVSTLKNKFYAIEKNEGES